MMRNAGWMLLALFCLTGTAHAADLSGTWQADGKPQRVLKVHKSPHGYRGDLYNIGVEQGLMPHYDSVSVVAVSGNSVHFAPDKSEGKFDGTLSDDGNTITGTWKMLYGPPSQPLTFTRTVKKDEWVLDASPHKVHFVMVQKGVKLEVLDFGGGSGGGKGPPLIFLAGLYGTGHSFDGFAEKFTGKHHVYAITRRGFGASSLAPLTDANYDADRMGEDVVAVMEALHIEKPVIAGHSIAGEELSSLGTRHPEKIAGLIYLDSLFQYAFYNPAQPSLDVDTATVRRDLDRMFDVQPSAAQWGALIKETQAALVNLDQSLKDTAAMLDGSEMPMDGQSPSDMAGNKMFANMRRYGAAPVPILAILAMPKRCEPQCDTPATKRIMAGDAARAELFEKNAPNARVVRIAKASHFIWRSNEAQVEQEMNSFMDTLH
jgi:pimeloyl-ACP methyl ester carboxylesterase